MSWLLDQTDAVQLLSASVRAEGKDANVRSDAPGRDLLGHLLVWPEEGSFVLSNSADPETNSPTGWVSEEDNMSRNGIRSLSQRDF